MLYRVTSEGMTADMIRHALRQKLDAKGVDLKTASLALGRNHAYLQQFIERGKPRYLHEEDRRALADLYQIDVDDLRPPPKKSVQPQVSLHRAPRPGDPIHDVREAALVGIWRNLPDDGQEVVFRMLDGLRRRSSGAVAA